MKRKLAALLCALLLLSGCGQRGVAGTRIFDTEKEITGITFHWLEYGDAEVAPENLGEVIGWLNTFKVHSLIDPNKLPAGVNTDDKVTIFYADGTQVTQCTDVIEIDGNLYMVTSEFMGEGWSEKYLMNSISETAP